MQQLITRDTLVDGLKVPTVYDCGSSVCLIPRRILLQLVAAKGDGFYLGRVSTTNLRIRGVTNHLLSTGQQIVLHLDTGVTQAAVPFLIDERVETQGNSFLPLLLGLNGLSALGFVLIGPDGRVINRPLFHQVGWKVVDEQGQVLFDGSPVSRTGADEEVEDPDPTVPVSITLTEVEDSPPPNPFSVYRDPQMEQDSSPTSKSSSKSSLSKRKHLPWVSQPIRSKTKKKDTSPRPRVEFPLSPKERAEKIVQRRIVDKNKGPIRASPTLKRPIRQKTSHVPKDGEGPSNVTQAQSSARSSRPVDPPRSQPRSGPPPGLTRLRRNSLQAYKFPVGHQKLSPDQVARYWRHKPGPPSKAALRKVSRQLIPDLISDQERHATALDKIRAKYSFPRFRNRQTGLSSGMHTYLSQLPGTPVTPNPSLSERSGVQELSAGWAKTQSQSRISASPNSQTDDSSLGVG